MRVNSGICKSFSRRKIALLMVEGGVPNTLQRQQTSLFHWLRQKKRSVRNLSIVDYRYFRVLMEVNFVHF